MRPARPRASAGDQRQLAERAAAQMLDDRDPGRVELVRRSGGAAAGHTVGLLDEDDAEPRRASGVRGRDEVGRAHRPAGSVAEYERGHRRIGEVEMGSRRPVRRIDV